MSHNLDEPLAAGRLELAYHDDGSVAPGLKWSIDLTFQGPSGPSVLRVIPGWAEESLAVEMPSFPALACSGSHVRRGGIGSCSDSAPRRPRSPSTGKDLAHGKGRRARFIALRLASSPAAPEAPVPDPSKTPVCHIDDLQLTRFAEPSASFELDIKQDEARLVVGDQLFGEVMKADSERVLMTVEGKAIPLPWGQISGLYFRRVSCSGRAGPGPARAA